jgi:hypothetical protein
MAKFCSECGTPVQAGAKYCHACGTSLDGRSKLVLSLPSTEKIVQHLKVVDEHWWGFVALVPIGLAVAAFVYSDFQQYTLTAAFMAPFVLVSYLPSYWLAKLVQGGFRVSFKGHLLLAALACIYAPLGAALIIERPLDLMESPTKSLLIACFCTALVIGNAKENVKNDKSEVADLRQ